MKTAQVLNIVLKVNGKNHPENLKWEGQTKEVLCRPLVVIEENVTSQEVSTLLEVKHVYSPYRYYRTRVIL